MARDINNSVIEKNEVGYFELYHTLNMDQKRKVAVVLNHYNEVIMGAMASEITSLEIVYPTVYSRTYQTKHQRYPSLAFMRELTGDRAIPRTKGQ